VISNYLTILFRWFVNSWVRYMPKKVVIMPVEVNVFHSYVHLLHFYESVGLYVALAYIHV